MLKAILRLDMRPGKRGAGRVGTPKKGDTWCNDAVIEEEQNARSSGRRKKGQKAKAARWNILSFWPSNRDEVTGKLCGISSVIASAKRLNGYAKRKLPSQLKFYPSKNSQSSPSEAPEPTSVSAVVGSSKSNSQSGSRKGNRHSQKNLKKNNLISGTPSASSTGESSAVSKPMRTGENSSQGETSLCNGGQNTTAASHASASTTGTCISGCRSSSISPGLVGNSGTDSVPTHRLIYGSNRRQSSEQNRKQTLPAAGTLQIQSQGQFPESVPGSSSLPNSNGYNPSCTVPSTVRQSEISQPMRSNRLLPRHSDGRQSGFSRPLSSDSLPTRPITGRQSDFSGLLSSDSLPTGPITGTQSRLPITGRQSDLSGILSGDRSPTVPITDRQSGFSQHLSNDRLPAGPSTHGQREIAPPLGNNTLAIRTFFSPLQLTAVLEGLEESQGRTPEQILDAERNFFMDLVTSHDGHGATSLDVDSMSYEELLILQERMGTVDTGISTEALCKSLRESRYKGTSETPITELGVTRDDIKCSICQEEYITEDLLGSLIKCQHGYHLNCISQWLQMKNWCPICRVWVAPPQHK